jgi:dTMP kinase
MIKDELTTDGYSVVVYKEQNNKTKAGKKIRKSYSTKRTSFEQELNWFIEDRAWNIKQRVRPALENGKIVFLDRYFFSTTCYQGARKEDTWEMIIHLNRERFPEPDLTIIFDVQPEVALERITHARKKSNTFEGLDYLKKVRELFLTLYTKDPVGNYLLIDSSKPLEIIKKEVLEAILKLLKDRKKND